MHAGMHTPHVGKPSTYTPQACSLVYTSALINGTSQAASLVDTLKKDEVKKEPKENLSFSPKDNVLLAIAHSPVDPVRLRSWILASFYRF